MEGIYVLVGVLLFLGYPVFVILVFVLLRKASRLRERVDILEVRLEAVEAPPAPRPATEPRPAAPAYQAPAPSPPPPPAPTPMPVAPPTPAAPPPPAAVTPPPEPAPVLVAASTSVSLPVPEPAPSPAPASAPARGAFEASKLEQLIGGIWLQNVGSVLLLLGSFFLILWGYTQGKIGPEILVAASVALGVFLAWRGDRIARTIRPLGSALLGVGLGIVYISLYLGHFRMHVLSEPIAFILLALVSFATVDIGLRRSQPVIAAFGVLGAFFPLVIPEGMGFAFTLPLHTKLAYLAAVNAVVFTLTAIRGWSGLVLLSLVMTSIAWATNQAGVWSLPVQVGLSLLYTALGIAPVIRLARTPDPIRPVDLAVVAAAPILLFVVSLPFFEASGARVSGGIFAALGVLNFAAAVWVDARRTERDLWRPLTAIGTMFLTAALERLLAMDNLALAWAVEGSVLIWLGLAPRGGWFRALGYAVSLLAAVRLVFFAGSYDPSLGGGIWPLNGSAIRDLLCIVTFIVISDRMARRREMFGEAEAWAASVWLVGVNLLLMQWTAREAPHYTSLLLGSWGPGPITAAETHGWATYRSALGTALAWTIQFAVLQLLGFRRRSRIQRMVGYCVGAAAFIVYVIALSTEPRLPTLLRQPFDPVSGILAVCVAVFLVTARQIVRRRAELTEGEGWTPALATLGANAALMFWTGFESDRITRFLGPGSPSTYSLWALATLVQAAILLLLSRRWDSRLERHVAYAVGTVGLATQISTTAVEISARPLADPFSDATGVVLLVSVTLLFFATSFLGRGRSGLGSAERRSPEMSTVAANVALMLWSAMEAGRLANALSPGSNFTSTVYDSTAMLGAVLTSACWVVQAGALLALGWTRRSPFLRWVGLSLVGITIVKFVAVDLQRVDIFWRFVIALGVGAVLLLVSFVYQRMGRRQVET